MSPSLSAQTRSVAITFDDLPGLYVNTCDADTYRRMNQQLVAAIRRNAMPALGLINESKLCDEKRGQLASILSIWLDADLDLGNHTFSHVDFNTSTIAEFEKNIVDGETTVKPLLASRGKNLQSFRFPFLRTGRELAKKRAIEAFLREYIRYMESIFTFSFNARAETGRTTTRLCCSRRRRAASTRLQSRRRAAS